MSRKRDLPPRCYKKHGAFYYVKRTGEWINLGRDKDKALQEYSRIAVAPGSHDLGRMTGLIDTALPLICHGKADSTARLYRQAGARLRVIFAEFGVEDVRTKHIAQVKVSMRKTPNLANRFLTVLRLLFGYAVEQQLCEWNPAIGVKPYPEAKRTRLLSDQEIDRIRAAATPRLRAIIGVQRITGQRIGDVLAIRRSDITEDGVVFVQRKTGAKVLIRWTPDLRAAVDEALALHKRVNALTLLYGRKGGLPDYRTVLKQWQKAAAKAGVPDARPNDLRAVAVTAAQRQGLDPQALAGHSRRSMTERYIREKMGVEVTPPALSNKVSKIVGNS